MDTFLRIDIDLAAIVLLWSVITAAHRKLDIKDAVNRLFLLIALLIEVELIFEAVTCIINGYPVKWMIISSFVLHTVLFFVCPMIPFLWCIFVLKWAHPSVSVINRNVLLLLIPLLINAAAVLMTISGGYVFSISDQNVYQRGPYFFIPTIVSYSYLFLSIIINIRNRKDINRDAFIPLSLFAVFPAIGGLVQTLFYRVLLMWSSAAFSFVVVYIFIQQRMMQYDKLTGTWTRSSFERYIEKQVANEREPFGLVFIDLDGFKKINDRYGHFEGDFALQQAAALIKKSLRKTDIVARFGGDEFVILIRDISGSEMEAAMKRLSDSFGEFNRTGIKPYRLEYSSGYELFNAKNPDMGQFLQYVDHLMYINKKSKREKEAEHKSAVE